MSRRSPVRSTRRSPLRINTAIARSPLRRAPSIPIEEVPIPRLQRSGYGYGNILQISPFRSRNISPIRAPRSPTPMRSSIRRSPFRTPRIPSYNDEDSAAYVATPLRHMIGASPAPGAYRSPQRIFSRSSSRTPSSRTPISRQPRSPYRRSPTPQRARTPQSFYSPNLPRPNRPGELARIRVRSTEEEDEEQQLQIINMTHDQRVALVERALGRPLNELEHEFVRLAVDTGNIDHIQSVVNSRQMFNRLEEYVDEMVNEENREMGISPIRRQQISSGERSQRNHSAEARARRRGDYTFDSPNLMRPNLAGENTSARPQPLRFEEEEDDEEDDEEEESLIDRMIRRIGRPLTNAEEDFFRNRAMREDLERVSYLGFIPNWMV
jgi:hypothetical protein